MNPSLPTHVVDKALAENAPKAKAEFQNIWREDLSDWCPADVIEAATDFGIHERAPIPGANYVAYCDASSGVADSLALAIAHRGTPTVLDVVRERKPRFVPAQVIAEFAQLLKLYGITTIQGDRYAIGFHEAEWRTHGINFTACENTTSENYLHVLPLLLAGRVRLVDSMTLRSQLSSLERRVGASDKETVSHPQHASAHDDVSAAACGVLALAASTGKYRYKCDLSWVRGDDNPEAEAAAAAEFQKARLSSHIMRGSGLLRWR